MIKKSKIIIYFLIFISFLAIFFNLNIYALSPTDAIEDKEVQNLKEKIATKVAELRQKSNIAVSGIVMATDFEKGNIKITTWKDEKYEVRIDPDLTKFFKIESNQKKEIDSQDIEKDSYIIASGIIKDNSVEANFVYIDEMYLLGSGSITEVDKSNYFIKVVTLDKENYTLDIETFTKQQMLNIKSLNFEKVGFSKIKEGDTAHFVVKKTGDEEEPNRFPAQKILIIPQEYFIK